MSEEFNKILKYNQPEKSIKIPFIIYAVQNLYLKKYMEIKITQKIIYNKSKQ